MKFSVKVVCSNDDQDDILHNFMQDDSEIERAIKDTIEEFYGFYIDVIRVEIFFDSSIFSTKGGE